MKRHQKNVVWLLVIIVIVAIATARTTRERPETVDGISLGMTREQVQNLAPGVPCEVKQYGNPVTTTFVFEGDSDSVIAIGQHPETDTDELQLLRTGVAYGGDFPVVGYDSQNRVNWVCGRGHRVDGKLVTSTFRAIGTRMEPTYFYGFQRATPRAGYCMGGPSAFVIADGRMEVYVNGPEPGPDRLYLLKGASSF